MKKLPSIQIAFFFTWVMISSSVEGQVPQLINYQGILIDPATIKPVTDNTYSITFSIYKVPSGGSASWSESHSVDTKNGLYSVILGSITALTPTILSGPEKYLGIKVGSDPEMTPRKRIVSVAYSILSEDAAKLEGKHAAAFAEADHNHDPRYYTKSELNTSDGDPPNQGSNRMNWNNLTAVPPGFADGEDNVGAGGDNDWTISGNDMYSAVSGNVGIGLSVPARKLHIGNGMLRIDRDGNSAGILMHRYNNSLPLKTFLCGVNASGEDDGYFFVGDNHTATGGTPDMRWVIDNDGNVGIGTSDPRAKLHIKGSKPTDAVLFLEPGEWNSEGDYGEICLGDTFHTIKGEHSVGMTFYDTNKFQFMGGNVGIGTTSPNSKLQVAGIIHATSGGFKFPDETTQTTAATGGANAWNLTGNSGTTPGSNFLGTTDNKALELKVRNFRALRLEPNETSPNLIGGFQGNIVIPGIYGATIGGGGQSGNINGVGGSYSSVVGGEGNSISSDRAFIGGGQNNTAISSFTAISGGWNNRAAGPYNIVGGGSHNEAHGQYAFIGGGSHNWTEGRAVTLAGGEENNIIADNATISGGLGNEVISDYGTIAGGGRSDPYDSYTRNRVTDRYGTIGGGGNNRAGNENDDQVDAQYSTVSGGTGNGARSYASTVGGGSLNTAAGDSGWTTVSGGRKNSATGNHATVCGGHSNTASGYTATVAGGASNTAQGNFSFAAGQRAKANHTGSFVWADYSGGDFASSRNNEFKVRASGGMHVIANSIHYGGRFDNQSGDGDGIRAYANVSKGNNYGAIYARNFGTSPAIYAYAKDAGYFDGDVTVTDSLIVGIIVKSAGSFKIDHPLDPANKYLIHSFVESPDMKNIYDGLVMLDARGEAWVDLPEWFEALNRDFRYQLTAIGSPCPNLYIAEKITDNRFKIAGGTPSMDVSWQVTGIRQDAFANAHRIPVEEEKSWDERGKYLHPKEHGVSETMGVGYEARLEKENK